MGKTLGVSDEIGTRHASPAFSAIALGKAAGQDLAIFVAPAACRISNAWITWHGAVAGDNTNSFTARLKNLTSGNVLGSKTHPLAADEALNVPRSIAIADAYRDMAAGDVLAYSPVDVGGGLADPERVIQFDVQWL